MPTKTTYSTTNSLLFFRYCVCILGMLSLVSCNKTVDQGSRKSPVKERKRQEEEKAAAKVDQGDRKSPVKEQKKQAKAEEKQKKQEAPRREQEERRARLDESYRREERRRQEAPRREQEERRARLDEAYRRDEERRRQEAAREAEVMSAAAQQAPAARVQEDEDDNVEEVYTEYPATPSNANPPSTDPLPNDRPDIWQPPFVERAAKRSTGSDQETFFASLNIDKNKKPVYGKVVFGDLLQRYKESKPYDILDSIRKMPPTPAAAKLYDDLDQNDSLSEAYAAQRHVMVQSLAREFAQGHSLARAREPMPGAYIDFGYESLGEHMRVYDDELKDRCGNELLFYDGTHGYYPEVMGERLEIKEKIRDALQQLPIEDQEECLKLTLLSEQEEFLRGRDIFDD